MKEYIIADYDLNEDIYGLIRFTNVCAQTKFNALAQYCIDNDIYPVGALYDVFDLINSVAVQYEHAINIIKR